jgi:two-component system response regulator PilR (NtrC family)
VEGISPEAVRKLESYDWPGNVRELENTMERAVALESTNEISLRVLPDRIAGYASTPGMNPGAGNGALPEGGVDFEKEIADTERRYLLAALEKSGGVRTRASELLKITYRSFRHYAKKHGL